MHHDFRQAYQGRTCPKRSSFCFDIMPEVRNKTKNPMSSVKLEVDNASQRRQKNGEDTCK